MKNIPIWTEQEIENRANKIMDFLVQMHPFLEKGSRRRECVELRPIYRAPEEKKEFVRSVTIWNSKGSMDYLKNFLRKINGKPIDAYFSVYAFDYDFEARKDGQHKHDKGIVNNENAQFTQIIPMDFDNISDNDHKKQIERLASAGIRVTTLFTGYGYHDHILLDKPCKDKKLVAYFTDLFLRKGFPVDHEIRDPARLMRLPYTNNCKAFDPSLRNYYSPNPKSIPTKIISSSSTRYSLEDVIYAISALPDIRLKTKTCKADNDEAVNKSVISIQKPKVLDQKNEYESLLRWGSLPPHIQQMLNCTRQGFRNKVLLYLVPYFRNSLKFYLEAIKSIMAIWATRCSPVLDMDFVKNEVERIYNYNFRGPWGKYTYDMSQEFGELYFVNKRSRENQVKIPNTFFDIFPEVSGTAVRIYLSMLLEEELRSENSWTVGEIGDVAGVSRDSVERNMQGLLSSGFINKKRSSKRSGRAYEYFISRYVNKNKGFMIFEREELKNILVDLSQGELKVFMLICQMIDISNRSCFASQEYLGGKTGIKQSRVSQVTSELEKKKYLRKETINRGIMSECRYELCG